MRIKVITANNQVSLFNDLIDKHNYHNQMEIADAIPNSQCVFASHSSDYQ
ncbi:MAG: hypothetical protein IH950_13545 [Bacteroidetes bacterium]|nr:hypothetical protein [Bacteroidota bacterium]